MGHVGLTPQPVHRWGDAAAGTRGRSAQELIAPRSHSKTPARFAVVVEAVPEGTLRRPDEEG